MNDWTRLRLALVVFAGVMVAGTVGYLILGFTLLEAVYQTVTTVTTVGFREVRPLSDAGIVFTIVLILVGVGTALYALGVLIQTLVEGDLHDVFGRRRMERKIAGIERPVSVCGWGRVGRAIAKDEHREAATRGRRPRREPAEHRWRAHGGVRAAPHVTEFLDVVMHDRDIEFRL